MCPGARISPTTKVLTVARTVLALVAQLSGQACGMMKLALSGQNSSVKNLQEAPVQLLQNVSYSSIRLGIKIAFGVENY